MILANISDGPLREALLQAAHPEEEVMWEPELILEALAMGYPRLLVETGDDRPSLSHLTDIPVVTIRVGRHAARQSVAPARLSVRQVRVMIEQRAESVSWVDKVLADLGRAAGARLPPALRTFSRRILEFPSHYDDLYPVAVRCGTTRGALKARFRRRGVPSPYAYVRWLRMLACAHVLADDWVTVAQAAYRLGFTSDGNLCRTMQGLTGLSPTEVRTPQGRNRLLLGFAWQHLTPEALAGWRELDDLFVQTA